MTVCIRGHVQPCLKHLLKPDLLSHFLYSECLSYLRINYTDNSAQAIIQTCSHVNLVALP